MGTGLTWDFAATSDPGILQRAQDGLDEEIAKTQATYLVERESSCSLMNLSATARQ